MAVETQLDKRKELKIVDGRIAFMDNAFVMGDKGLYRLRDPLMTTVVRFFTKVFYCKPKLIGTEYLDYLIRKIESQEEKLKEGDEEEPLRITIAPNHTSDWDHPCLEYALLANGYSKLAERLLFGSGMKMWDRWQTSWAMAGMNTFPIAAPGYYEDADTLCQQDISDKEKQLVRKYIEEMNLLNKNSFRAIHEDWEYRKALVVIYLEATRSRDGLLKRGRIETKGYLKHGLILPVMIDGVGDIFPPGKFPRLLKSLKRDAEVTVAINEPIDARVLWSPGTKKWLEESTANQVDFVMSRIAALNPERVDPKFRPFYESLSEDIPDGLLLKAA